MEVLIRGWFDMRSEKKAEYIILGIVVIFFLVLNYLIVNPLVSLPSPIYGGDYYHQLGTTNNVRYGGNPLESPNIKGSLPVYMVLYSTIVGNLARIFNLDSITAEFLFSYVIILLSASIMFMLVKKLFNNTFFAVIGVLAFITPMGMPVIKYTDLAYFVMMPLILFLVYRFINESNIKNSILLGLAYGLTGLTHSVAFMSASFLLLAVFLYYVIIKNINLKERKANFIEIKKKILSYVIIFLIGVSIALLWWYKPLLIYHGQTSPHYTEWNNMNWGGAYQFKFLWQTLQNKFFDFSGLRGILISIFSLAGIAGLIFIKEKDENPEEKISKNRYIKFLFISSLIITFHYFITQNIFNVNFIPGYIVYLLLSPILVILFVYGINFSYYFVKRLNIKKGMYLSVIILLLVITQFSLYSQKTEDKWYKAGLNQLPDYLVDLKNYLVKESTVNDVILTTKEIGFAVNALTGRKLLSSRRAHNDPFTEMDSRELAQAVILYGNNTKIKKEFIKEYGIKYFYWDYYWIQSEYYFNEGGQVTGWFDPLILFYSEENENILKKYGVKYFIETTWVDPALKGEDYKKFKLIFISSENYYNTTHPWQPDLDPYLKEVWSNEKSGQKIGRLFEFAKKI